MWITAATHKQLTYTYYLKGQRKYITITHVKDGHDKYNRITFTNLTLISV